MSTNKKGSWILIVVIVIVALGIAGYYLLFKKAAEPIIWDGTYKMTGTLTCEGNFPGLTTVPMDTTITVLNNKVMDQETDKTLTFDIDKHGKASETIQLSQNGVDTTVKADYQFSKEDDVYKFAANGVVDLSATKDGQTYSSTCSGPVTGIKQ